MSRTTPPLAPAPVAGLFAAVATPIQHDGRLDLATFDRLVDGLVRAGVSGICISGATGEYPHFETADRVALIRRAAARLPRESALLVGIGGPTARQAIVLGEQALDAGSSGLLLPMPMFFRYEQHDLEAFATHVSDSLRAPCLLYDLPGFTNGLAPETVLTLLRTSAFLVGIKDSSGEAANLASFAQARGDRPWSLLVGDDRLLYAGLAARWNGAVSGVAGFCPELLVALHRSVLSNHQEQAVRFQALLDELIAAITPFPTPWGVRIGLEARGLPTGPLPLPLSTGRRRQIAAFTAWFPEWLVRSGLLERSAPAWP